MLIGGGFTDLAFHLKRSISALTETRTSADPREPSPEIQQLIRSHMEPIFSRFATAIHRVLPELPREELFWRMQFVMGAMHRALLVSSRADLPFPKEAKKLDAEGLLRRLVAFGAQGMKAPFTR